jgi:hypothetical protein
VRNAMNLIASFVSAVLKDVPVSSFIHTCESVRRTPRLSLTEQRLEFHAITITIITCMVMLRHYVISQRVAGSRHDEVIVFQFTYSFRPH